MKVSFQIKLFISLVAFFSVLFALLGGYYYADVGKQLYQEMSTRAKIQAEEIALIPTLRMKLNKRISPPSMILCRRFLRTVTPALL
jgi:two-component system cit operon sensor histidine kinase CitA